MLSFADAEVKTVSATMSFPGMVGHWDMGGTWMTHGWHMGVHLDMICQELHQQGIPISHCHVSLPKGKQTTSSVTLFAISAPPRLCHACHSPINLDKLPITFKISNYRCGMSWQTAIIPNMFPPFPQDIPWEYSGFDVWSIFQNIHSFRKLRKEGHPSEMRDQHSNKLGNFAETHDLRD